MENEELRKIVGERIKKARELRNMRLEDVSNDVKVAKSTIQRYEAGKIQTLKIPVIDAIARSLNVDPAWLSGKDVPMERVSDSERFQQWSTAYNDSHNPLMVSENEKTIVEKYRILDDHGKKIIDLIIDEEYSRCNDERESEISLSKDELAKLPYEERLKFLRFENGDGLRLVARRNKKDVRK